jgi:hypothetical protein
VFENRVLRRIFGPKGDDVTEIGGNCIMRSFVTFFSLPSMNRMIKSGRMRWAGLVARMRRRGLHVGY